jgi:hypothetical protein
MLGVSLEIPQWRAAVALLKTFTTCGLLLALANFARGVDLKVSDPTDENVYETDRPGEVENPFTVPPGSAELVNYVVGLNEAARAAVFGSGGSALFVDTAMRFGIANRIEGVVTVDSFLHTTAPRGTTSAANGFGYATLLAKWNFLKAEGGDFGVALAPFVRLPLKQQIGRTSRAASGLSVPFDFDLDGGWELEGSSSVTRGPEGIEKSDIQWENQVSLQRTLMVKLTTYLELQLEAGGGPPAWAAEFGVTVRLNPRVSLDLGSTVGIGRTSRGRALYAGSGWRF